MYIDITPTMSGLKLEDQAPIEYSTEAMTNDVLLLPD